MDLKQYFQAKHATQEELAAKLGVTQSRISIYLSSQVPAERVLEIETATKGLVKRWEMRPDLYPPKEYRK